MPLCLCVLIQHPIAFGELFHDALDCFSVDECLQAIEDFFRAVNCLASELPAFLGQFGPLLVQRPFVGNPFFGGELGASFALLLIPVVYIVDACHQFLVVADEVQFVIDPCAVE